MKQIFEVSVPEFIFPGFYNTDFDPENILTNDDEKEYSDDTWIELSENYMKEVVERIANHYKEVLPKSFRLLNYYLESPKSYNYFNDKIILEIETTYEQVLYEFFTFEEENLFDYIELEHYQDMYYHEMLLEILLTFWPFTGKYSDLYETTLHEKFIYG